MARGTFRIHPRRVAGIDAVESATSHAFPRHTHDQFGIGVIDRGAQRSRSRRGLVEAGAGDVITVHPGEVHDGAPIGDGGRAWRILYMDAAVIAEAACEISPTRTYEFASPVIRDRGMAGRVAALFAALADDEALHCEGQLLSVLAGAMGAKPVEHGIPAAIRRAQVLVDDDPAAPVTLADLARASGLSRFQVLRGFVRATGLTPHAYLMQRRIGLARRLIARGLPLAEAAAASGFADQSHMTRAFGRAYGLSPGAYARART